MQYIKIALLLLVAAPLNSGVARDSVEDSAVSDEIAIQENIEKITLQALLSEARERLLKSQLNVAEKERQIAEKRKLTAIANAEAAKLESGEALSDGLGSGAPKGASTTPPVHWPAILSTGNVNGQSRAVLRLEGGELVTASPGSVIKGGFKIDKIANGFVWLSRGNQKQVIH